MRGKRKAFKARAAEMLVEAAIIGDDAAAAKYGCSTRTLYRWRAKLLTGADVTLTEDVKRKNRLVEKDWADEVSGAMLAGINYLRRAAEKGNVQDPQMVHAIAGALKMINSVSVTRKVLDARLGGTSPDRQADEVGRQVGTKPEGVLRELKRAG